MTYIYRPGSERWRRHDGEGDVRRYRPRRGWEAEAELMDVHPVTGQPLANPPEWWIREVFTGQQPTRQHHH
ncbi:MAG: hypothetical protein LM522_02200 [Candidatus Contendobacter sp.]|nr:hypothetical protein [Candidatus Contendobacter sp.]